MKTIEVKYSKDGKVWFDPLTHTYWYNDARLLGVTSFINNYKNKFDADKVAEAYAKKHHLIKEDLLLKWKNEGELSRNSGIAIHSLIENYYLTGEILYIDNPNYEAAFKFVSDYFETGKLVIQDVELVVYNDVLASQIDCIVKNKVGEYFILDWKVVKKISDNGYNKYMKDPYQKYADCNYYHYSLQLSIYKKLCKEYPIKEAYIVHLKDDQYCIIKPENMFYE